MYLKVRNVVFDLRLFIFVISSKHVKIIWNVRLTKYFVRPNTIIFLWSQARHVAYIHLIFILKIESYVSKISQATKNSKINLLNDYCSLKVNDI